LKWSEQLCTANKVLHGGALMSLADTSGALLAFYNLPEGSGTSTIESKTNFLRGVNGGYVTATSTVLHAGRTTIVVVTDIFSTDAKHIARVTQTQAVIAPQR
jgi:1,4-dihydroxy-2-naphthoyl-CoA hydrolase